MSDNDDDPESRWQLPQTPSPLQEQPRQHGAGMRPGPQMRQLPLVQATSSPESPSTSPRGTFYIDNSSSTPGTPRGSGSSPQADPVRAVQASYFLPHRRYSHAGTMTADNDEDDDFEEDEDEDEDDEGNESDEEDEEDEDNEGDDYASSLRLRPRPSNSSHHSSYSFPGTLSSTSTLPVQSVQSYYSGSTLYYPEGDPRANELGEHAYIPPGERSITTRADFEESQRAAQRPRGAGYQQQQQQRRRGRLAALRLTPAWTPTSSSTPRTRGAAAGAGGRPPYPGSTPSAARLARLSLRSVPGEDEYHSFMYGERRGTYSGRGGRHRDL